MVFIIVLVSSLLIVPIVIDYQKHPSDNIIRRSLQDIVTITRIGVLQDFIKRGNEWLIGAISLVMSIAIIYLALKLLGFIISLLSGS